MSRKLTTPTYTASAEPAVLERRGQRLLLFRHKCYNKIMPNESQPGSKGFPRIETDKTEEQLRAELDQISVEAKALHDEYEKKLSSITERREEIFAKIRYLNSKLRPS